MHNLSVLRKSVVWCIVSKINTLNALNNSQLCALLFSKLKWQFWYFGSYFLYRDFDFREVYTFHKVFDRLIFI